MRILQVMAGAEKGGAETAFVDICAALDRAGVEQLIVTRENDIRVARLRAAGLVVSTLPFGGAIDIYTPYKLKQIIKDYRPHIVQSWMARASSKLPSSSGKNFRNVARLGGYYNLKYFKHCDYFVGNTPMIKEYLVAHGIADDHVRHINNFAETEMVSAPLARADLNTPDDAFVCLALARYHSVKALDILIKSIAALPPHVHLWLAGEGPERANLEALTRTLNLEPRVHFLGWRTDRAALLQAADLCVLPSRSEPFGTVFVQAWAQKTPVVSSLSDGPRQFMQDGVDGLLVPIDDVPALNCAIKRMMDDKNLREALVQNGFARYQNEFTAEICVKNYLEYYTEILRRESITL